MPDFPLATYTKKPDMRSIKALKRRPWTLSGNVNVNFDQLCTSSAGILQLLETANFPPRLIAH